MKDNMNKLTDKTAEYNQTKEIIDKQKTWKGSIQPFTTKIKDDVNKKIDKVTSWFRKWF
ncbi:conserved hypothetical protein [Aster yellows witches'-broom phytoplasma AYWB]|uniref:Uncharacterized protein n=1 Tax=Aster yellows witches'-broom phytoplasma (strain AYWB) TaxID=322098 RepID=Q2NJD3_AYWBP|nr:hypothetical protein [New Jersey aster yellows phytoplasma]ABC65460.1 conserved hypothetical protein [Aster yellows witches'-broom phytoplasma AYWB]